MNSNPKAEHWESKVQDHYKHSFASFTSIRINPFTSFEKRPHIWFPGKPIDYITVLGFSSLWHEENLAWCSDNKDSSFYLTKHGNITEQVVTTRQFANVALHKFPRLQLK